MVRELILRTALCSALSLTVVVTGSAQTTSATGPLSFPPSAGTTKPGAGLLTEDQSPFESIVFYCTNCKQEVPEAKGAGSECPHCGAFFRSATNADGSTSQVTTSTNGFFYSARFWGAIALATIFASEYVYRSWRRSNGG